MAKGEGEEEGGEKGKPYLYCVAFDFWSSFVLRVLVDVGGDFAAVGARFYVMLVLQAGV